jgi:hypothetical protein
MFDMRIQTGCLQFCPYFAPKSLVGALGISVKDTQILGCVRTYARTPKSGPWHDKIWRTV